MRFIRAFAITLVVTGILAVLYGGVRDVCRDFDAPRRASIKPGLSGGVRTRRVDLTLWAGVGGVMVGGALLVLGSRATERGRRRRVRRRT